MSHRPLTYDAMKAFALTCLGTLLYYAYSRALSAQIDSGWDPSDALRKLLFFGPIPIATVFIHWRSFPHLESRFWRLLVRAVMIVLTAGLLFFAMFFASTSIYWK